MCICVACILSKKISLEELNKQQKNLFKKNVPLCNQEEIKTKAGEF